MTQKIKTLIQNSISTKEKILENSQLIDQIENLAKISLKSLKNGGKIILAGNGGSFADAQHISAEFTSRYMFDRDSLPSICLGANSSSISAIGNDYGFDQVFARELFSIGNSRDIFIPISTSGNSKNIIEAVKVAKEKKIQTVALTGETGGELAKMVETIKVPSNITGRIQESHIMIGHIVCEIVESQYFK